MTALASVREGVTATAGQVRQLPRQAATTMRVASRRRPLATATALVAVGAAVGGALALLMKRKPSLGEHALDEMASTGRWVKASAAKQAKWLLSRVG